MYNTKFSFYAFAVLSLNSPSRESVTLKTMRKHQKAFSRKMSEAGRILFGSYDIFV